ncbi:MAG TPA: prepilin-type N-terminal cleavage/methylation domain-containing protein [bacterium]|nr:prepilin-type N-terminal cleavage/methylation domain-containing protein [bacterium]
MRTRTGGFTLIELLIVVAIIGILAAIAIPNFLSAQVRAKVARVTADLATLAGALETYCVDNNRFPLDSPRDPHYPGDNCERIQDCLTTPIGYLASASGMYDPFRDRNIPPLSGWDRDTVSRYEYWEFTGSYIACNHHPDWGMAYMNGTDRFVGFGEWMLASYGPDTSYGPPETTDSILYTCHVLYDPTNGATSAGEIVRCRKWGVMESNWH